MIVREWIPGLRVEDVPGDGDIGVMVEDAPPATDQHWLVESVSNLLPRVLFILGGMTVLLVVAGVWYLHR